MSNEWKKSGEELVATWIVIIALFVGGLLLWNWMFGL